MFRNKIIPKYFLLANKNDPNNENEHVCHWQKLLKDITFHKTNRLNQTLSLEEEMKSSLAAWFYQMTAYYWILYQNVKHPEFCVVELTHVVSSLILIKQSIIQIYWLQTDHNCKNKITIILFHPPLIKIKIKTYLNWMETTIEKWFFVLWKMIQK